MLIAGLKPWFVVGVLVSAAAASLVGAWAGYRYADAQGEKSLAECVRDRAEQQSRAVALASVRVQAARVAGDEAVRVEAARRLVAEQQTMKVSNEIKRLAVGRPCLSGELVGVLNRTPGIGADALHGAPGGAADAAAAVAEAAIKDPSPPAPPPGGEGGADDTTVAEWISDAAALYDTCRGRIDALRTWSAGVDDGRY
jgi:hypothetical protein